MQKKIFTFIFIVFLGIPLLSYAQDLTGTVGVTGFCPNLNVDMWHGNRHNNQSQVKELQLFLINKYGSSAGMIPTGFFGKQTKNYLARFQKENNIRSTGGLGPLTRNMILKTCSNNNEQVFCPAVYQPICGQPIHECCTTSANKPAYCTYAKVACEQGTPKTYSNTCELNKVGAKFLYNGECTTQVTTEAPANCKVWYDGCNTCSRSTIGGPLMCTLMACFQGPSPSNPATCREYFTSSTEAPVIKSFSGPVQLRVNQTGTWSVQATIFNNQQLTYNITWGDERNDYKMAPSILPTFNSVVTQNSTFEHSYSNVGNYTVTITVTAQNGQTSKTTSTVNVTY